MNKEITNADFGTSFDCIRKKKNRNSYFTAFIISIDITCEYCLLQQYLNYSIFVIYDMLFPMLDIL